MPRSLALVVAGAVVSLLVLAGSAPAAPTLSVSDRLDDRRYVVSGDRAYVVGTQDGRFPALGFHTRGEMGGVWTPPLKLLDGIWFGIDGAWLPAATRFTSGFGHATLAVPGRQGLTVSRTDVVPDGRRAALFGLRFRAAPAADQRFTLRVQAHSELMSAYPWGETKPNQDAVNRRDTAAFDGARLVFGDATPAPSCAATPCPAAPVEPRAHDWAAVVGAATAPTAGRVGPGFRGPQEPARLCPRSDQKAEPPERCDDTGYGRGAGGELRYDVVVPAGGERTVWLAAAGSDRGLGAAQAEHAAALNDPAGALHTKVAGRTVLAARTRLSLPGDPLLARVINWGKQNLADAVQSAEDLRIRVTLAGKRFPAPRTTVPRVRFLAAGFPDYPWLFATDGEYTAFASVAVGQFEPMQDHLRALRDVSLAANGPSGKVMHEMVTDGTVYFGANADPGNTDETAKFPSAVALLWRWTGDRAWLDEMYAFARANMRWVVGEDRDGDGWPQGAGNVERPGMGDEKLDNAVYTIRGLRDLAALARARGDGATRRWAERQARRRERAFERTWWMATVGQHADSLRDPGNRRLQQRHWIGLVPLEAEIVRGNTVAPGLTTGGRARRALALRERRCFSGAFGLWHTGRPGCDSAGRAKADRQAFTLTTAIAAVAEGNYGRLGADQQGRYTAANRRLVLPRPDEQPGAMPEIAPSPDYGRSIDKPLNERAMVLQAWGHYGTAWPVVRQQLGVRPDLGRGALAVVPRVPPGQGSVAGQAIRLGAESADVTAIVQGRRRQTIVRTDVRARLTIGHAVPAGRRIARVTLDGRRVRPRVRDTHRGREVLVRAGAPGTHRLVVTLR